MKASYYISLFFLIFLTATTISKCYAQIPDSVKLSQRELNEGLINAAFESNSQQVLDFLNRGASINYQDAEGVSALMYAAEKGDLIIVEMLMLNGANLHLKPRNGIGALSSAVRGGHIEVVKFLLEKGADINEADADGLTPLMHSIVLGDFEMMLVLLDYKVDLSARDYHGNMPLHLAVINNNLDMVKILLGSGADINSQDAEGFTPLIISAQFGYVKMAQFLIDQKANVNQLNKQGHSALILAIKNRQDTLVEVLVAAGADVNLKFHKNLTPLDLAYFENNFKAQELLLNNHAEKGKGLYFGKIMTGLDTHFLSNDFLMGVNFGIYEMKDLFSVSLGFIFRPVYTRVQIKQSETLYYQYWEQRNFFFLAFTKYLPLTMTQYGTTFGAYVSANPMYTFGQYRNLDQKAQKYFLFSPQAGFYWDYEFMKWKLGYAYLPLKDELNQPHRITLGLQINIGNKKFNKHLPYYLQSGNEYSQDNFNQLIK